jgi:hypothetical protein
MIYEHIHSLLNQIHSIIAFLLGCNALYVDMTHCCDEKQPSLAESPTLAHIGRKWLDTARATQDVQITLNGTHFSFEERGYLV